MIKPKPSAAAMQGYRPPTEGRQNSLRLDFNENTSGCSPSVVKALRGATRDFLSTYPEYTNLRKQLAKYCHVDPEEVIPTNGTDEAIKAIMEAYLEPGKSQIIIPVPTYTMFTFYAQLNGAVIREIPYKDDLSFPAEKVLRAISENTKMVVLVNPNNPTGTSIREQDIIDIVEKANTNNALVLIDEAYCQFSGKSSISLIKKFDNLFITRTFSKAFGLAGLRLGYILSNKNNIGLIKKVLSPYSVNAVAALCASAAMKDIRYIKEYVTETNRSKIMLYRELDNLGISYYRSDANFVLLRVGKRCPLLCRKLKEKGILVRDRSADQLLDGCLRITLGTVKQTTQLIGALRQSIKELNPLLVFDIDGVLVDVSRSYRLAVKKTGEFFTGSTVSFEEIQGFKNKGNLNNDWDLTETMIKSKGKMAPKKEIIRKFQEYYSQFEKDETWLLDRNILEALSRTYSLALVTGRPGKEAYSVLRRNKTLEYFDAILAREGTPRQKPAPDGLQKVLKRFPNETAFYFGDSVDDMKAAANAGINPIGVLPPQDTSPSLRNILIANGAERVIENINQVQKVLEAIDENR
ncbi:histidinol-phosphate transaminase [Candidatus Woesearchaeota archaeon]|nr:histidinol-phosphate transaminase [Candidatus Woesearchaeota archaeon]